MKTNPILNCLIIEDEPLAQELIAKYVQRMPELQLLGKCDDAISGFHQIKSLKPDIVFLDINMPEMSGMELLKTLGIHKPYIIITTGYPDFAVESYSFDVTDYLLKPIAFDRFVKSIERITEKLEIKSKMGGKGNLESNLESTLNSTLNSNLAKFVFVKIDKKNIKIYFDDIVYIEGMKDYVKIHLNEQSYIFHATMKKMEEMLLGRKFLRINRSFIINSNTVHALEGNQIELTNKLKLDIGVTYRESVISSLGI